jgi:hypothetical protein
VINKPNHPIQTQFISHDHKSWQYSPTWEPKNQFYFCFLPSTLPPSVSTLNLFTSNAVHICLLHPGTLRAVVTFNVGTYVHWYAHHDNNHTWALYLRWTVRTIELSDVNYKQYKLWHWPREQVLMLYHNTSALNSVFSCHFHLFLFQQNYTTAICENQNIFTYTSEFLSLFINRPT